jgi:hypothetical protein
MALVAQGVERRRIERLLLSAIRDLKLDLTGLRVLTEAASGPFATTALAAALAGAETVLAVSRDSRFGLAREVSAEIAAWAAELGVADQLTLQTGRPVFASGGIDLVTNLGFVRPIDDSILSQLSDYAAVALMWEPWEARGTDIDFAAAQRRGIPVVGTNEHHPRVRTLDYVGMLAAKLLLESGSPIFATRIAVIGSAPFGPAIAARLETLGASLFVCDPKLIHMPLHQWYGSLAAAPDAIVLAEHRTPRMLIGDPDGLSPRQLDADSVQVVHICGAVDTDAVALMRNVYPSDIAPFGWMTRTTSYVGAKPVVDLHVAGLRAGEIVVRSRRRGLNARQAVDLAVAENIGLAMDDVPAPTPAVASVAADVLS